jgi:hypothetical protein
LEVIYKKQVEHNLQECAVVAEVVAVVVPQCMGCPMLEQHHKCKLKVQTSWIGTYEINRIPMQ